MLSSFVQFAVSFQNHGIVSNCNPSLSFFSNKLNSKLCRYTEYMKLPNAFPIASPNSVDLIYVFLSFPPPQPGLPDHKKQEIQANLHHPLNRRQTTEDSEDEVDDERYEQGRIETKKGVEVCVVRC